MFGNYFILTIICFVTILKILSHVSGWELSETGDTFWFLVSSIFLLDQNGRFYVDVPKLWSI